MNILRYLLLLSVLPALPACQSSLLVANGDGQFEPLTVTSLVLHEDVRIPPRQAHAAFQRGSQQSGAGEYSPHCELEVRQVFEEAQTVLAGRFEITQIRGVTHYVKRGKHTIHLAAGDGFQLLADDSNEWIMLAYHFRLHSDTQPNVLQLMCGGAYNFPFFARYPDVEDMRLALGNAATLILQ